MMGKEIHFSQITGFKGSMGDWENHSKEKTDRVLTGVQ